MSLALPCDGVAPLLLPLVCDPFALWSASMERQGLVKSFARRCEVPRLIAPSPVAVTFPPFGRALQECPTAVL